MRVLTVVGARPQFVKHGAVAGLLRARHTEVLVHTGQHYDHGMSATFFDELQIPEPDHNLGIAGGPHGQMTGRMMEALEQVSLHTQPDWILVYGDTNSTLAAALVGAKLHVPVAHVEAGLRSFNRRMPEETNRVVTDHVSTLLLCPTQNAVDLLAREGIERGVHLVGDVMYDSVLANVARARQQRGAADVLAPLGLDADAPFALATMHRPENTDEPARLAALCRGLADIGVPVVLPLHPRTKKRLAEHRLDLGASVHVIEPIGYLDLLLVASSAAVVLTDSGGLQKEAFFVGVRCVTMRDETEWVETVAAGANEIVGADAEKLVAAAGRALAAGPLETPLQPGPFGDGKAAAAILKCLEG